MESTHLSVADRLIGDIVSDDRRYDGRHIGKKGAGE
jgi:hypothetical protein